MTLRRKRNQLTRFWRGRQTVDPCRCRNADRVGNQIVVNEAMKVPLVVVPNVGVQPRCAQLHQIGWQGDSFDGDRFDQTPNRCECFASADCDKDIAAFNRAKMRLDGFSERPCQRGFLHEQRHGQRPVVFRSGPGMEPSAAAIQEPGMDFRNPQLRATIIRYSIATAMSAQNLYEFPRADHAQYALI